MTEEPTREQQLLHLVDRARRGVALPEELDQLTAGITQQAARMAEQRMATVESLNASQVTLRRHRRRIEQVEADRDRVQLAACRTAETLRRTEERAERAESAVERVRALHDSLAREDMLASPEDPITRGRAAENIAAALDGWTPPALDEPQPSTTTA